METISPAKESISVVFLGSTHHGKSSLCGQILILTGQVDDHTLRKSTDDAIRHNHKESALANLLNTTDEEREAARTVELGRADFDTERKHCVLLDAPGHRDYIPSMIQGASMADVGVLVVSARIGEFEAGLDGGQTKEHILLAKTLGLQFLIVLVSKMDDVSVAWKQVRYDTIVARIQPILKSCGFVAREVAFLPASAHAALNIHQPVPKEICPWLTTPQCLFQMIDDLPPVVRDSDGPLRISVRTHYKDMGAVFLQGKVESGSLSLQRHKVLLMMPTRVEVQLQAIMLSETHDVRDAGCGAQVLLKIKGIDEDAVQEGFVLCATDQPCRRTVLFEAQLRITELPVSNPIVTIGFTSVLHLHALTTECTVHSIVHHINTKTGQPLSVKSRMLKVGDVALVRLAVPQSIACESYKDSKTLGRFTLRSQGLSIAIGKIMRIKDV